MKADTHEMNFRETNDNMMLRYFVCAGVLASLVHVLSLFRDGVVESKNEWKYYFSINWNNYKYRKLKHQCVD